MSDLLDRQEAIEAILHLTSFVSARQLFDHIQRHHLAETWIGGVGDALNAVMDVQPVNAPEPYREEDGNEETD